MPRGKVQCPVNKRDAVSSPPRPTKRQTEEIQQTPGSFWDNLSRQWLTRRALREFDRRTSPATLPPERTGNKIINLAQLKRFAMHGGPSLSDLRAVI